MILSEAIIASIMALFGVVIGALLAPLIDWLRSVRTTKRNAQYLAIRIVCILDQFIDMCVTIAGDNGEPDQNGMYDYSAPRPELQNFPEDIDWKSIDHKIMYEILALPNKIDATKQYIRAACDHWISAPYDDLAAELQYEYSTLGLAAMDIANKLRDKYDIPYEAASQKNPDWDTRKFLQDTKARVDAFNAKHEASQAKFFESIADSIKPKVEI